MLRRSPPRARRSARGGHLCRWARPTADSGPSQYAAGRSGMGCSRFSRHRGRGDELRGRREITMSSHVKRIDCLPILVGFPALGALCEAAGCGPAGPAALCSDNPEAALADWLTGRGCGLGIPISRDRASVYMCRALLGGDQHVPAGAQAASFPGLPADRSPFACAECAGDLTTLPRCPHGQLISSVELGCGQIAVPVIGAFDLLR